MREAAISSGRPVTRFSTPDCTLQTAADIGQTSRGGTAHLQPPIVSWPVSMSKSPDLWVRSPCSRAKAAAPTRGGRQEGKQTRKAPGGSGAEERSGSLGPPQPVLWAPASPVLFLLCLAPGATDWMLCPSNSYVEIPTTPSGIVWGHEDSRR